MFVISVYRESEGKNFFLALDRASGGYEYYTEQIGAAEFFPTKNAAERFLKTNIVDRPHYEESTGYIHSAYHGASGINNAKLSEKISFHVMAIEFHTEQSFGPFELNLRKPD
jgi:hypothetical protein